MWWGSEVTHSLHSSQTTVKFCPHVQWFGGMPGLTSIKHWLYYNIFLIWMPYCLVNVSAVHRSFSLSATVFLHYLRNASIWTIEHWGRCHQKKKKNTFSSCSLPTLNWTICVFKQIWPISWRLLAFRWRQKMWLRSANMWEWKIKI